MVRWLGLIVVIALLVLPNSPVHAIGYQSATIRSDDGRPIAIDFWYPSRASPRPQAFGPFHPDVAVGGGIAGQRLPVVIISHGTGGSVLSHYDTAAALAQAGFVVVTFNHPGDNYQDQSNVGFRRDLIDRPRQAREVLDFVLQRWSARDRLDPSRIGMFGFSLGGFTTLVAIGGTPDLGRTNLLCSRHPEAPDCGFIRDHHGDQLSQEPTSPPNWVRDPRIKAAVVAAPAASFVFGPGSLKGAHVPVQIWSGTNDKMAPAQWNSDVVRRELPTPPDSHVIIGAGHLAFLAPDICTEAPPSGCEAFHRSFNAAIVTFFESKLATS